MRKNKSDSNSGCAAFIITLLALISSLAYLSYKDGDSVVGLFLTIGLFCFFMAQIFWFSYKVKQEDNIRKQKRQMQDFRKKNPIRDIKKVQESIKKDKRSWIRITR